ncbi:MAG TPA: FtsX-like permease family protein [bacterium]|nr:FtsX-like permease family protein [bacterium]
MDQALLLFRIALRNVFSSFLNVVIGLILLVGTLLFVVGGSLVNSMDKAMSRSIIGSIAGNLQVYQASSKDSPSLFEQWQIPDLDPIPDFSRIKGPLLQHPNVAAVVPEGINTAILVYGNTIDQVLEKLRKGETPGTRLPREKIESLKAHVRQMITVIQTDMGKLGKIAAKDAVDPQALRDLAKASSPGFWRTFDADPLDHLEFLENHIAYLVPDSDQIFLGYVGTDLDSFTKSFDRLQIVDGQAVPPGHRGMLLSKYTYEEQFKLKAAHRLDQIHEALTEKHKKIAKDPDLQDLVKQNRQQTREIVLQLDPLSTKKAVSILQGVLGSKETEVAKLLSAFFDTDDANFEARYKVFYDQLAPLVDLYRIKPGDFLTIKAYTKSGYVQAVSVKVYGTFQFKGLEKSGLAGGMSLMDLMSFRDLYGYITPDKIAETQALKKAAGATYVPRDKAEEELFGGSESSVVQETHQKKIDVAKEMGSAHKVDRADLVHRTYSPEEMEKGVALGAAIILKDPSKMKQTLKELQEISDRDKLGLKVIDWQKAAGNLGQFVFVAKGILYFATAIIFVVALVIINNAVVMATLQRVREIGTLRAIGARRAFVLAMVLTETVVLGLVFGTVGALLGTLWVGYMGKAGIPAANDFLYFFFSGPKLYPWVNPGSLIGAFFVVLIVTCISALYPALMATRVSPVTAMASDD